VERLREVLAYRRLGFGLREIAALVGDPFTDAAAHLRRLRGLLLEQRDRADAMVAAIDRELEARAKGKRMTPEEQLEMFGPQLYDAIGGAYTATRRTDPGIAASIWDALGDARTVLNVGAGTGSYEPPDRDVTAVEPSAVMRAQRPAGAAPCVAAVAESLPFADQSFDAAMAVSTAGSGLPATTCPSSPASSPDGPRWPGWPARSTPAQSRYPFRGTALTASSRPTGAGPGRTWRTTCAVRCRRGQGRAEGRGAGGAQPPRRP
jgi:DNA-binding transcriptional MerR regulator